MTRSSTSGGPLLTDLQKSEALARADVREPGSAELVPAAELAGRAQAVMETEVPFPPGLDSASRLDWRRQTETGALSMADVRALVQSNALCDWIRFAAVDDLTGEQRTIVSQLASWPTSRGSAWTVELLQPVIDALLAGDREPALAFVTTGPCRPHPRGA